jgi:hypothetical protein
MPTPTPAPTPTPHPYVPTISIPAHQYVESTALPQNIREAADGFTIFTAEPSSDYTETTAQERVFISMPHSRNADTMPQTVVAYRIDVDGTIELVIPSLYIEAAGTIRFLGYTGEFYMVSYSHIEFTDVSADRWYYNAISFVSARGIFSGVGNNLFAPQSTMTRAMFITALSQLDGTNLELFDYSPFGDVEVERWYGTPIAWAKFEGIICDGILGDNPHNFSPNANITREEMAVIFANYLAIRDFPLIELDVPQFYDLDQASPQARNAIQAMRRHSIISGVGGNRYSPQSHATRAEVAQIFTNLVSAIVGLN